MDVNPNPYAVSPTWDQLQTEVLPTKAEVPRTLLDRGLLVLILATCVIGSAISTFEIESIIPSGITLSILGTLLIIRELFARRKRTAWNTGLIFGAAGPLFSAIIWAAIFVNRWGPGEASRKGVPVLCVIFAVAMCAFGILAFRSVYSLQRLDDGPSPEWPDTGLAAESHKPVA